MAQSLPEEPFVMTNTTTQPAQCRTTSGMHPLEIIPAFRRIPRSLPRDLVYTFIWNILFAILFVALNLLFNRGETVAAMLWPIFVIAQCIGYSIHALFAVGERLLPDINARGLGAKALFYTVVPLVGTFIGYWLAATLLDYQTMRTAMFSPRGALAVGTVSIIISSVLLLIFIPRARAARIQAAFEREQARVAVAERTAALAQLKLLEAQVEPHFLYNTLANIVSLIDSEPATAKRMIERLIALLRGAAGAAGSESTTLSAQIEHLRAYLELMTLRMGGRLAFSVDIPAETAILDVPPLLLQPLVENAIRHGLEPNVDGGSVRISARRDGRALELVVADTGVGFAATRKPTADGGLGIANLRARLRALYGAAATLVIEDNVPAGARITVRIPVGA